VVVGPGTGFVVGGITVGVGVGVGIGVNRSQYRCWG
jgi:hypothetical protein